MMQDSTQPQGLSGRAPDSWPEFRPSDAEDTPLSRLADPELHGYVLGYLNERLRYSAQEMKAFHSRWTANERRLQGYVELEDWDQRLQEQNDTGRPAQATPIRVPYAMAALWTIRTYLLHTFCANRPLFPLSAANSAQVGAAETMELLLQYQADHTGLVECFNTWFQDALAYGVGVLRTKWCNTYALRTRWQPQQGPIMQGLLPAQQRKRELVYSGNEVANVDPFRFLPDPRFPMTEVNRKGEFVFWRDTVGLHELLSLAAQEGSGFAYIDQIPPLSSDDMDSLSDRNLRSLGQDTGDPRGTARGTVRSVKVDQGTIEIVPQELGLGEGTLPEKWIFSIANGARIIQARQFGADHDLHPVAVIEPFSTGYGLGQLGMMDYLAPIEDLISFLANSRMANVKTCVNNMFVYDPHKVEEQDLQNPEPGLLVRLRREAWGTDVRQAIQQFPVVDVTQGHVRDMELLMKLGERLTAASDALMGIKEDTSTRKTATEVRVATESAASRLAALARVISVQGVMPLVHQLSLNTQQYLTEEFEQMVAGADGVARPLHVTPGQLVGDYYYMVHDGTLPVDKGGLIATWKEIFLGIAQNPQLAQRFDLVKIFEYLARIAGAVNIKDFAVAPQMPQGMPGMPQPMPPGPPMPGVGPQPSSTGLPPPIPTLPAQTGGRPASSTLPTAGGRFNA